MRLRRTDLLWQDVDSEVVVLDLESSQYLRLNRTGGVLWHRLVDGCGRGELVAALVDAFDVTEQQASADVDTFMCRLDELGFLR